MSHELELAAERHVGDVGGRERHAQQIAEPRDHDVGGFDVLAHQRGDGVERVEQKVRMDLHLQRLHLRAGERGFEWADWSSRSRYLR